MKLNTVLKGDLRLFLKNLKMTMMSDIYNTEFSRKSYKMHDLRVDHVFEDFRDPIVWNLLLQKMANHRTMRITEENLFKTKSPYLQPLYLEHKDSHNFYDPGVNLKEVLAYIESDNTLCQLLKKYNMAYTITEEALEHAGACNGDLFVKVKPQYIQSVRRVFLRYKLNTACIYANDNENKTLDDDFDYGIFIEAKKNDVHNSDNRRHTLWSYPSEHALSRT